MATQEPNLEAGKRQAEKPDNLDTTRKRVLRQAFGRRRSQATRTSAQ